MNLKKTEPTSPCKQLINSFVIELTAGMLANLVLAISPQILQMITGG